MEDSDFRWFALSLGEDLSSLWEYVDAIANALAVEQKRRLDHLSKIAFDARPEDAWIADELRGNRAFQIEFTFPHFLWSSTFVSLMSYVEMMTFALCDILQKRAKLKLRHQDLKGDGLRRARTYIEKVCNLPFKTGDATWQELMKMGRIRNAIVHRGGEIGPESEAENDNKEIWTYINTNASKGIASNEGNLLTLGKNYCTHGLSVIGTFFDEIRDGLPE
jgi:hypothetical protein